MAEDFLSDAQVVYHNGGLVVTDEYSFAEDETGLWSGTQTMYVRLSSLAADMPARESVHPFMPGMYLETKAISGEKAGWVKVTGTYKGIPGLEAGESVDPGDTAPEVRYRLSIGYSEDPIQTNPEFDGVSDALKQMITEAAENPKIDADGNVVEPDTAAWGASGLLLYDLLRSGVKSYRVPRPTWSKSWVTDSPPANLNDVGKRFLAAPEAPAVAGGRDWLCTGVTFEKQGLLYTNEQNWELSGPGGWIDELYDPA